MIRPKPDRLPPDHPRYAVIMARHDAAVRAGAGRLPRPGHRAVRADRGLPRRPRHVLRPEAAGTAPTPDPPTGRTSADLAERAPVGGRRHARPWRAGAGAARPRCRSRPAGPPRRSAGRCPPAAAGRARRAGASSHLPGLIPVSSRNRRVKVRTLIDACRGQVRQLDRLLQPLQHPGPGRPRCRRLAGLRHRALDELGLAAVAPRRYDAAAGRPVGHLAAVVAADHVQAQVDAGGDPGRGEHVAVVDEQHVGVQLAPGGTGWRNVVGVAPSGWSPGGRRAARPRPARRRRCRST